MLALGLVDPDTGATFELDDGLVASYSAVDVSLETDDGDPQHSVTSLLRGTYEPEQITTTERNHDEETLPTKGCHLPAGRGDIGFRNGITLVLNQSHPSTLHRQTLSGL